MTLLPALLLPLLLPSTGLQASKEETLGRSYAQILQMGSERWSALYAKERGDSTAALAGALGTYGDALAWRNDRLLKGQKSPLRTHLQAFSNDLNIVGNAATGGGTIWTIFSSGDYLNVEETLYRILTHSGKAPKRVTSDVTRALTALEPTVRKIDRPEDRMRAREALARVRVSAKKIFADARGLSRRDSDTVLEFCRTAIVNTVERTTPQ